MIIKRLILAGIFILSGSSLVLAAGASNKKLGAGLNLGEPLGVNGRYYLTERFIGDLTFGYAFGEQAIVVQPNILFAFRGILDYDHDNFSIVPYAGIGLKAGISIAGKHDGEGVIAARLPIGVNWVVNDGDLEFSLEFSPGIEFNPKTQFDPTGGIGMRYYFF